MIRLNRLLPRILRPETPAGAQSSLIDPETGLPSRLAIMSHLKQALAGRRKLPTAIAIVEFSDNTGGATANDRELLRRLGALLRGWVPAEHDVGHLREREFAVVMRGHALADVEQLAGNIVQRIRSEPSLGGRQRYVATIIGVAYSSRGDCDVSQLMTLADIALHYARSTGRSWHAIVDSVPKFKAA